MIEKLSEWLVENELIEEEDKELYTYGFEQGCVLLLNIITVVVIGIMMNVFWKLIVFTFAYALLRPYAGGFHARNQRHCYVYSILLLFIVAGILRWISWNEIYSVVVMLISGAFIFKLAPVADENKPLDSLEIMVYKCRSRCIYSVFLIIVLILLGINKIEIAVCIVISTLAVTVMLIMGEIRNQVVEKGDI